MSELIDNIPDNTSDTDFVKVSGSLIGDINYKLAFFMFIIGVFIFSDLFIEGFLSKFDNTVADEYPTTKGTMVQLLILCIFLIILELLIKWRLL